jgi:hypothetical protein
MSCLKKLIKIYAKVKCVNDATNSRICVTLITKTKYTFAL